MEMVINTSYGTVFDETKKMRFDPQFIDDVKSGRFVGHVAEGMFGGEAETLRVVSIPDDASDFIIVNYDGVEGVIYTLNGKIHCIYCENIL